MVAVLNSGNQPTSGNVRRVMDVSSMVANVGIVSPAHRCQYLFPPPVSVAAILKSVVGRRRKMSGNVDSAIFKSGLVENVEVEVEIALLSQAVGKLLPLPLYGRHLGFPAEGDVGFISGMAPLKRSYPKIWG